MNAPEENPDFHSRLESDMEGLRESLARMRDFIRDHSDLEVASLCWEILRACLIFDPVVRSAYLAKIARVWETDVRALVEYDVNAEMEAEAGCSKRIKALASYRPKGGAK